MKKFELYIFVSFVKMFIFITLSRETISRIFFIFSILFITFFAETEQVHCSLPEKLEWVKIRENAEQQIRPYNHLISRNQLWYQPFDGNDYFQNIQNLKLITLTVDTLSAIQPISNQFEWISIYLLMNSFASLCTSSLSPRT